MLPLTATPNCYCWGVAQGLTILYIQTAAWYIAMAQVAIEALGTVGSTLIKQNTKKKTAAREKAARDAEFDVEFAKVADLQADFDDSLSELVPTVEKKPGK